MKDQTFSDETKAVKLLQDRSEGIASAHSEISDEIALLKAKIAELGEGDVSKENGFEVRKNVHLQAMSVDKGLLDIDVTEIYREANLAHPEPLSLDAILTANDWKSIETRLDGRIVDFNKRYALDGWDYAIAGGSGLFAAMLDLLCVKAPPRPTVEWSQKVDGIFNQGVQKAFNYVLPPDLSSALSKGSPISGPDSSVITDLIGAPKGTINPINHRLRSLAHDPLLGLIFGVRDMMNGTCTVVVDGEIRVFKSTKGSVAGGIPDLLIRMFKHLASDVNAPSANGNRGMGLPAPFMGLLKMFDGIPVGDSTFGKQIEWMYVRGYDFRQFVVSSIPMAIMELLMRACYVAKQVKLYDAPFGQAIMDTMPGAMNPRFRIMLALAYGTSSAINAGKMYVTGNILNANYASWMGLTWNGFHALRWALLDRHLKLWAEIENKEIEDIESLVKGLDELDERAALLPT